MFRRKAKKQSAYNIVNYIMNISSIGDTICTIPALRYAVKHYKKDFHIWISPNKLPLYEQFIPNQYFKFSTNQFKEVNRKQFTKTASLITPINNANGNLIEYFNWSLLNKGLPESEMYYPKWKDPGIDLSRFGDVNWKKCVILPVNFIWLSRAIFSKEWNKIISYLLDKEYTPVFIGKEAKHQHGGPNSFQLVKSPRKVKYNKGLDLRDKTNIHELLAILSKAKAMVGVDSGVIHMASMTNINIIAAYTSVDPAIRIPIRLDAKDRPKKGWRFDVVVPEVECRFCASQMILEPGLDFINCFYDDFQCVKEMKAEKFIEKLEKIL